MTKEKEIECDCKMFIGGSGKLCPECSKQNYKDFEKLCKEQGITFNDDVFNSSHLDSGNMYAFYSEARKQGQNSQKEKDCKIINDNWGHLDSVRGNEELTQKIKGDEK